MDTLSDRIEPGILKRRFRFGNAISYVIVLAGAASLVFVLAGMVVVLTNEAWRSITEFGFGFLTSTRWNPNASSVGSLQLGALPAIYGTVVSSLLAVALAVPVAVGVAIFLSEVAPGWVRTPVSFLVEMLAAVPSVVFGLWGLFVLAPIVRDPVEKKFLVPLFGWTPFFKGTALGLDMLAAAVILAIMILPIIAAISRDVMRAVPQSQREAALALGATQWEAIWEVVLPYARPGITGAVILGLGRALGETMAVLMLIGNSYRIDASVIQPSATLASTIAAEFAEAANPTYRSAIVELGLVLLMVTLLVNVAARLLVWRISSRAGGSVGR